MYRAMWETAMDDVLEVRRSCRGARPAPEPCVAACGAPDRRQRGASKNSGVPVATPQRSAHSGVSVQAAAPQA